MRSIPLAIAMMLGTAAVALAQNPSPPEPHIVRPPLTQADLSSLSSRLMMYEMKEAELRRMIDEFMADPLKWKSLAPPNAKDMLQKQLKGEPPKLPPNVEAPLPHGQHPQHHPQERPAVQTNPPPLSPAMQNNPTVRNLLLLWEKNIGPLDKTPALKKIFADLLRNSASGGGDASSPFNDETLNSLFNPETPAGREIAEMLEAAANGTSWKWADLGLDDWKLNLPETHPYTSGGTAGAPPTASDTGESPPIFDLLLALAALAIAVIILLRARAIRAKSATRSDRPHAVRIDPNSIHDRASLVQAFEAVSLNTIGREAAAWNHCTIAAELNRRIDVSGGAAAEAARLYELARYAPPNELLPSESILQARRCLVLLGEAAPR